MPNFKLEKTGTTIQTLEIGETYTEVPFMYQKIENLMLGSNITEFDTDSLQIDELKSIVCYAATPPALYNYHRNIPTSVYADAIVYVPAGSIEAYKAADGWSTFWNIQEAPAVFLNLNAADTTLIQGETFQLKSRIIPRAAIDKPITWSSSDEDVATVSETGLVTAVGGGTATITATCEGVTATCEVTVQAIAQEIELNEVSLTLNEDESFQLEATVLPEDAVNKTVTWSSSDKDVATVSKKGLVEAVGKGTATITATCGNATATCEVTVMDKTGIEEILQDRNAKFAVYDLQGILVRPKCTLSELQELPKGIYILTNGKERFKVAN